MRPEDSLYHLSSERSLPPTSPCWWGGGYGVPASFSLRVSSDLHKRARGSSASTTAGRNAIISTWCTERYLATYKESRYHMVHRQTDTAVHAAVPGISQSKRYSRWLHRVISFFTSPMYSKEVCSIFLIPLMTSGGGCHPSLNVLRSTQLNLGRGAKLWAAPPTPQEQRN